MTQGTATALRAMSADDIPQILVIEHDVFPHPWTAGNFLDALSSRYHSQVLAVHGELAGYIVWMTVVDELHLLDIAVGRKFQRQGFARVMMDDLSQTGASQGLTTCCLEVRDSNLPARAFYSALGFVEVGRRKHYYPASHSQREDAILMNAPLPLSTRVTTQ